MKRIIGIDPGVEGAIVVLSTQGEILQAYNMPVIETVQPKKKKKPKKIQIPATPPKKPKKESLTTTTRICSFYGILELINGISLLDSEKTEAFIEEITHLFGLPSSVNFQLGHGIATAQCSLQAAGQDYHLVPVKKWQAGIWKEEDKVFKDSGRVDTKKTTKRAFERLFPTYKGINSDGVRDAALIGWYGFTGGL